MLLGASLDSVISQSPMASFLDMDVLSSRFDRMSFDNTAHNGPCADATDGPVGRRLPAHRNT